MGIDLYCVEQTFGCGYGYWSKIRNSVIKATFTHISIEIKSDKINEDNNEE
jgi:predicted small metal-binding protein